MVAPDSPGDRAGLGVDDEIKAIDGQPVAAADAPAALRALPPGRPASLTVTAHFQTVTLTLVPAAPHAGRCEIVPNLAASPAQLQLRRQWLGAP